jgi:hypothetical protein
MYEVAINPLSLVDADDTTWALALVVVAASTEGIVPLSTFPDLLDPGGDSVGDAVACISSREPDVSFNAPFNDSLATSS